MIEIMFSGGIGVGAFPLIMRNAWTANAESVPPSSPGTLTVANALPIPIVVYAVDADGNRINSVILGAGNSTPATGSVANSSTGNFVVTSQATGSYICYSQITSGTTKSITVNNSVFNKPNDVGPIPTIDSKIPIYQVKIPPSSPLVLVACGVGPKNTVVCREQYWNLQGDSYSLAPNEKRTVSFTVVSGRQNTSSTSVTVAESLGMAGSVGWGPASASISASLSASASFFQQTTVTEQSTSFVEDVFTNGPEASQIVLRWQLTDVITIFAAGTMVPQSGVVTGINPVVAVAVNLSAAA